MRPPLQISFRNSPLSQVIADTIEKHASKLAQFYDHITRCRVVIDVPHRHHQQGNVHRVHIDIAVPANEIVVSCETDRQDPDLQATIGEAFDQAARQLQDYVRRRRGQVKTHHTMNETPIPNWILSGQMGG
jgi:ribosome-associated translation inhibitor RaiA